MTITSHDNSSDPAGVSNNPGSPEPSPRKPHSTRYRVISRILLAILLLGILTPLIVVIGYGISGYTTYNNIRNQAQSGVQHLLNVKTIFTSVKAHPSGFLDNNKLSMSRQAFVASYEDFQQVEYKIDHTSLIQTITTYFPQYLSQVRSARAVSQIGMDISVIGQQLTATALILAPTFRGPLLTDTAKPLITQQMLDLVGATINEILPELNDIQAQSHFISLDAIPVSEQQRNQLQQLLQALPQIQTDLVQVLDLLGVANWLLGVNEPRTFLVQTMDRAELRPTGGFTGQYGELRIQGGRIAPFNLRDISLVEYVDTSKTLGQFAPSRYRSWWPFANWGLRDSNVSADFPTSAQIAINQYELEVGHQVDGVILVTPFLIEHILQIIGPIYVPEYKDTITAQNLEDRLHYYQQDNAGIYKQIVIQPGDTTTSDRKRFTGLLAHLLLDKIRNAPPDEILAVAQDMLHDLKTRDLQVYFDNPQAEALLVKYDYAAQLDRSTTQDGLYVVQANLSASKASQYVKTILHDTVTLDAKGGATHVLQLRLVYNQIGPVYGYDTYHDYVRIYVPSNSQFLWGDGFDTGIPLCGGSYQQCQPNGVYPQGELLCPTGQFQSGAAAPSLTDPDPSHWHPLDTIGPPTNLESDEPGRAMFGGWVIVPKNCTMTVTVSWYVPPLGTTPYSLQVQRQTGTFPELDLTILPTPGNCNVLHTAGLHFDGVMSEDMSFTTNDFTSLLPSTSTTCYPQPGI
ncbi:MAG TPA: DUF4012 domain-containing protein [Ktedonobacteraceae bacterium]|nr:DUF4012 domain-containing protein [Ktedonobacteraceae bacterium]